MAKNKKHTLIKNTVCDHVYTVTIGTELGQFTASVFCRPEDRLHEIRYIGWELAEIKAEIKYSLAKKRKYENQFEIMNRYLRDMSNTRNYNESAYYVKQLHMRIEEIVEKINAEKMLINKLRNIYHEKILLFEEAKKRIKVKNN